MPPKKKRDIVRNTAKLISPYAFNYMTSGHRTNRGYVEKELNKMPKDERDAAWTKIVAVCGGTDAGTLSEILGVDISGLRVMLRNTTYGPTWTILRILLGKYNINPWWILGASEHKYLIPADTPFTKEQTIELQNSIKQAIAPLLNDFNDFSKRYAVPVTNERLLQNFILTTEVQTAVTDITFTALNTMAPQEMDAMLSEIFIVTENQVKIKGENNASFKSPLCLKWCE